MARLGPILAAVAAVFLWADSSTADSPRQVAQRALAAHERGDADALRKVAAETRIDLWPVCELLATDGYADTALALARAAPKTAVHARLAEYAAWRKDNPIPTEVMRRLRELGTRKRSPGEAKATLQGMEKLAPPENGVAAALWLRLRARLLEATGRPPKETIAAIEKAAHACEALGWLRAAIEELDRGLVVASRAGRHDTVLAIAAEGMRLAKAAESKSFERKAHWAAAGAQRARGKYDVAIVHATRALERAANPIEQRNSLRFLLVLELETGRRHAALRHLHTMRRLNEETGDEKGIAATDVQIASIEATFGRFTSALARIHEAVAYFEEHGTAGEQRGAHLNAGRIWLVLQNAPRALEHLRRARELSKGLDFDERSLLAVEAVAFSMARRFEESARALGIVIPLQEKASVMARASTRINLAFALARLGRHRGAAAALDEARALLGAGKDEMTLSYLEATACFVHLEAGDIDKALAAGEVGRNLRKPGPLRQEDVLLETRMARARLENSEPKRALACAERAIEGVLLLTGSLPDRIGAHQRTELGNCFAWGIEAAAVLGDKKRVFRIAEQAAAVALRSHMGAGDLVEYALSPELRAAEHTLEEAESLAMGAYRVALAAGETEEIRTTYDALRLSQSDLEHHRERIRAKQAVAGQTLSPCVDELGAVRARLKEEEALVVYAAGARTWALVVTRSSTRVVPLGLHAKVQALTRTSALEDASTPADETIAKLARVLIAPLALPEAIKRIRIAATGSLAWIPFAALMPTREVVLIPSATVARMLAERAAIPAKRILAVGTAGPGLAGALPQAEAEAKAIGDVVLVAENATERAVRAAIGTSEGWRAIHLACHGLIDPSHALRSAILLQPSKGLDGLWTVSEILGASVKADLVALSACSSAGGEAFHHEGVVGLAHAFFVAGARRVLVSIWDVDDLATAELVRRFYAAWQPGTDPATALHEAQTSLRSETKWKHPSYWAGWQLWGVP